MAIRFKIFNKILNSRSSTPYGERYVVIRPIARASVPLLSLTTSSMSPVEAVSSGGTFGSMIVTDGEFALEEKAKAPVHSSCIAPRPFMMTAPTDDEDMPRSGVDSLIPVVSSAYEAMGRPDHFKVHQPPGRHVYLVEYFDWMVSWFQRFL